jgi:protein gp37
MSNSDDHGRMKSVEILDSQRRIFESGRFSWNPVTGCSKISAGCGHRYAERMAGRLKAMGQARYRNGLDLTLKDK